MPVEITVLSTTAMKTTLDELVPLFEQASGEKLSFSYAPSARLAQQIGEGLLQGDIAILTAEQIEDLAERGRIVAGSRVDIAGSRMGLAVQAGARKPDISTVEGFKKAILDARSLGMSNPVGGGVSGVLAQRIFERLGIAEAVRQKVTYGPGGPQGLIGLFLKRGEVEVGIQQMPELMAVPGIDIVGPFPDEIQTVSVFSLGTLAGSAHGRTAGALAEFLRGPQAQAVLRAKGMEPA